VFCVGVFLAFVAHVVLETISDNLLAQILVGAAGLAIMTGVAYYRLWSKQVDKPVVAKIDSFNSSRDPRGDQPSERTKSTVFRS
jgi:hypothetical protein